MNYAVHWRYCNSVGGSSFSSSRSFLRYLTFKTMLVVPWQAARSLRPRMAKASGPDMCSLGGALPPKCMPKKALQSKGSTPFHRYYNGRSPYGGKTSPPSTSPADGSGTYTGCWGKDQNLAPSKRHDTPDRHPTEACGSPSTRLD